MKRKDVYVLIIKGENILELGCPIKCSHS